MAKVKTTTIHIYKDDRVTPICGGTRTVPEEGFLQMCEKCYNVYVEDERYRGRRTDEPTS